MARVLQLVPRKHTFSVLYVASFVLSFHLFFVSYMNSSFLATFTNETYVGLVYICASAISMVSLLYVSRVIQKIGNYRLLSILTLLEFFTFLGLAFAGSAYLIIPIFILYNVVFPLILYTFDIFFENLTIEENTTGSVRGTLLTIVNAALVFAPLTAGFILHGSNFHALYLISSFFLVPFYLLMRTYRDFEDPHYHRLRIRDTVACVNSRKNLRNVFIAQFLLRFFFSWMVIYMPIYLNTVIGFSWTEIGTLMALILIPYIFLEYPAGHFADKYFGERKILVFGFITAALFTGAAAFLGAKSFLLWVFVLLFSRVGASLIEIMTESYFFKRVNGSDNNTISFFRITRPVAFVFGPMIGTVVLSVMNFQYMWLVLGILLLFGVFVSLRLDPVFDT